MARGACHAHTVRTQCVTSKDGRDAFLDQPCTWCCGSSCLPGTNEYGCQPHTWLMSRPDYSGTGENGEGYNTCTAPLWTRKTNGGEKAEGANCFALDVRDVATLRLVADEGPEGYGCDQAAWVNLKACGSPSTNPPVTGSRRSRARARTALERRR